MKPIIIYSDKTLNRLGILFKIGGITLWPFIILREAYQNPLLKKRAARIINHESIHIKQQEEMLVIPFYVLYLLCYIWNILKYGGKINKAYRKIPFEQEAYVNEEDYDYLTTRRFWSWVKHF
jgi:hypothetical protein